MSRRAGAIGLLPLVAAAAPAGTIPLEAGDYGGVGLACDDQPDATIMSFDGRDFSYPHATACIDRIVRRKAGLLTVSETCHALGDGSAARPSVSTFEIRLKGPDRFALVPAKRSSVFHRCGPLGYFDRH